MQCVFISLAFITIPLLHLNKPPRESNFCGKVGDWWIKRVLLVLNFLLKSLQGWQVDGWEGKRAGKLMECTNGRLTSRQGNVLAPERQAFCNGVGPERPSKEVLLCSSFGCCRCPCAAHRTRKRSRTSITGNPAPTNNLTLYLD